MIFELNKLKTELLDNNLYYEKVKIQSLSQT